MNAEKRKTVETMLLDPEWRNWSDNEIGKRCEVDGKTVAAIRNKLGIAKNTRRFKKNDIVYNMNLGRLQNSSTSMRDSIVVENQCIMYTYIIGCKEHNHHKIGRSTNPYARLSQINCASPFENQIKLVIHEDCEKKMHKVFKKQKIKLEWFNVEFKFLLKWVQSENLQHTIFVSE